ncbi:MAG: hypothetical protein EZS28_032080 [Streblomastix strix]|uniref:Uncharacterized protein n=1 Tax=Streblomastix strix TaxID=222440 RepID=A0A5J4UQR5_9EUKA|nr:MAG: hypothetical protein EZS28_032080 [Streblomastix strix]
MQRQQDEERYWRNGGGGEIKDENLGVQWDLELEHQEMESEETDVVIGKKDPISGNGHQRTATDITHSWSGEQFSGPTEQDVNK